MFVVTKAKNYYIRRVKFNIMAKTTLGSFIFGAAVGAAWVFLSSTEKGKKIVEAGKAGVDSVVSQIDKMCADNESECEDGE